MKTRFKKTKHKGIRQYRDTGNYNAYKRVDGKYYSETFTKIRDAIHWRNTFNPYHQLVETSSISFKELWGKYEDIYFPTVELSTQGVKRQKIKVFRPYLDNISINDITPDYLDEVITTCKKIAIADPKSKRCNFDKALDEIKAVLSWYKENYDYTFHNPVLKRHYAIGIIKKTIQKEKVLSQAQLISFLDAIDNQLFQDLAIIQFFCASRFGETAGIQVKNIDLENKKLLIKETVIEDQSRKFLELKLYPKNGHSRAVSIDDGMFRDAITRRLMAPECLNGFLFTQKGRPLSYRSVQYHYEKALKKAGLYPEFSGTHFLRYTMATESRRLMNSLDAAQAITGHHSVKLAEQYAKLPSALQSQTIKTVGENLRQSWESYDSQVINYKPNTPTLETCDSSSEFSTDSIVGASTHS